MSLATSTAFRFNPSIQHRAFIAMGCLARGCVDDSLMIEVFGALRRALQYFEENECQLIASILMCLTNFVESSNIDSRYLRPLFWVGIAVAAIGHVPLFGVALHLVQVVLRNLYQQDYCLLESPAQFLMAARAPFESIMAEMDKAVGVNFHVSFDFAIATIFLKGLKHASTKSMTTSTLSVFLEITSRRSVPGSQGITVRHGLVSLWVESMAGAKDSVVEPSILGFLTPLLPIVDASELKELLCTFTDQFSCPHINAGIAGIQEDLGFFGVPDEAKLMEARTSYRRLFTKLAIQDELIASLFINFIVTMLENTEYESEAFFIYNVLAEAATAFPGIVSST